MKDKYDSISITDIYYKQYQLSKPITTVHVNTQKFKQFKQELCVF